MTQDDYLKFEAEIYAEMFQHSGSFLLSGFLNACLSGYGSKMDFREFTAEERDEIILNFVRMTDVLAEKQ